MKQLRTKIAEATHKNKNFEVNMETLDDSQFIAVNSLSEKVLLRAPAGSGKALCNGTKVLTINGWKNIEDLKLEDLVAGSDGKFHKILGIYPQGLKQIYEVEFSDGNVIKCSPDHLWTYQTKNQRDEHRNNFKYSKTKTIKEILETEDLKKPNGAWNVYIPMVKPIDFKQKDLPLDPYLLGVLLGDGNISDTGIIFTCAEPDLLEKVNNILSKYDCSLIYRAQYDYSIVGKKGFGYHNVQDYIGATITQLGLRGTNSHTKFIPELYLYADIESRMNLLKGLIDTDGSCEASEYNITLASKQLILDIQWLCESLGFTAYYSEKESSCNGKDCGTVYRLNIKTSFDNLKIHTTKNKESRWKKGQSDARRTIREIRKTDDYSNMTCIEIDSPDHLFVTEHCIVTHNTKSLITAIATHRYEWINDRICAITYTRAARAEMETRLQEMGIYDVEVTTIHVWARNLLVEFSKKYDFKINILEEPRIKAILEELIEEYLSNHRGKYKIKNIKTEIVYSYISGNKQMDISDNYRRILKEIEDEYVAYKMNNGYYDFTDYPRYLYDVINAYDEDIKGIDALFVDEFQDVDEIQFKLFEKVIDCRKKFFVGDAWQSIFVFRGADGEVFKKAKDFDAYKLKCNYRSYQEVIDYSSTVYLDLVKTVENAWDDVYITQVMYSRPSAIECNRGYGGEVVVINPFGRAMRFTGKIAAATQPLGELKKMLKLNPMILCRTNKQVKFINEQNYFEASTIHQAKGLEYDNVIVIDTTIKSIEDLNVAYVAMTRAKNKLLIINWNQFEENFEKLEREIRNEII